jgi:hypothetical protein
VSAHLRSRHEVGRVLAAGPVPVTELRAAMIIGSSSASFEMLRPLAVAGTADHVDLGGHQPLGKGSHHLSQQIAALVALKVLAQPLERVHRVGDCHPFSLQDRLAGLLW